MDDFLTEFIRSQTGKTDKIGRERSAIERGAKTLGIDPVDYATAISYETAGTFSPTQRGPRTKWGQHRGTIQYGEPQWKEFGVTEDFEDQVTRSNVEYLRKAGVRPGMTFEQLYAAINGGDVNKNLNTPDADTGRTIADNIRLAQRDHRQKAMERYGWANGAAPVDFATEFIRQQGQFAQQPAVAPVEDFTAAFVREQAGKSTVSPTQISGQVVQTPSPAAPVPETPATLEAQLLSVRDNSSPKAAVLLTDAAQERLFDPSSLKGLQRVQTPQGILYVNPSKAPDYAKRTVADLIGKVDEVQDTSKGSAVLTTDAQDNELSASIVGSPDSAQKQAEIDKAAYPQATNQQIVGAQDVARKRETDNFAMVDRVTRPPDENLSESERELASRIQTLGGSSVVPEGDSLIDTLTKIGEAANANQAYAEPAKPLEMEQMPQTQDNKAAYNDYLAYATAEKIKPMTFAEFEGKVKSADTEQFGKGGQPSEYALGETEPERQARAEQAAANQKYQQDYAEYQKKYGKSTVASGGQVSFPREVGKATDDLNTEAGRFTPTSFTSNEDAARQAMNAVLNKYDVTPQEVDAHIAKYGTFQEGAYIAGKPIIIPFHILRDIKGEDYARQVIRREQAEGHTDPNVGIDLRVGQDWAKQDAEWVKSNAGKALIAVNPLFAFLDEDQRNEIGATMAGTVIGGGGDTARAIAGLGRILSPSFIAGTENLPESQKLNKNNTADTLKQWADGITQTTDTFRERTKGKGAVSQVVQVADPSAFARLILLSALPGGVFTAMTLEHAGQAAGSGAKRSEVAKQAAKGATLGVIFKAAPIFGGVTKYGVGTAIKSKAAQEVAKQAGTVGAIAYGTEQTEKAFGSTEEQAFHSAIVNSLFHLGGVLKSKLVGKTIRAKTYDGKEAEVTVTPEGEVKLLKGGKEKIEDPDIEMYFNEKSGMYETPGDMAPVRAKEEPYSAGSRGNRLETSQEPRQLEEYNPQRIETPDPQAVQKVSIDTRARKIVDALRGKNFTTIEEVAKLAKVNKVLAEDAVMNLYGAGMVELLPGNRVRLISEPETTKTTDLFERAKTYGQAPQTVVPQPPAPSQSPNVVSPAQASQPATAGVGTRYERPPAAPEAEAEPSVIETLPQQKEQIAEPEKPKAKVITLERPDASKLMRVSTERGTKASIEPKVIDSSDIITSLDEGYPAEFQPRDRSRIASKAQISDIANKLDPDFLGDSPKAGDGRPLVVPVEFNGETKYAVISGNGRTAAIREAYNLGNEPSQKYAEFAKSKGGTSAEPVYVGVLDPDEVDLTEFAREANESAVAQMSATEQAKTDADRLDPGIMSLFVPSDDGSIHAAANREFIRGFMERAVGTAEQGRLVNPDGSLNQDGVNRVRNAIFAKAFGDTDAGVRAIQRMAESTSDSVKTVTNALLAKAGQIAELKESAKKGSRYAQFDISNDLANAVEQYAKLKSPESAFKDIDEYISQGSLFGAETTPLQTRMMMVFDQYKRSPKGIKGVINNYLAAAEAIGDPNQANLFGENVVPSVESIFEGAVRSYERSIAAEPTQEVNLFDTGEGRENQPEPRPESVEVAQTPVPQKEQPRTETVTPPKVQRIEIPEPLAEPVREPSGKPIPPFMRSVVRRELGKDRTPEEVADIYDLDVAEVSTLRAIHEKNVGKFGQTSYYIRRALQSDENAPLINQIAKVVIPQARIHLNNPLFDRATSVNAILDTIASDVGKLRSSQMDAGDWNRALNNFADKWPREATYLIHDALAHQEEWHRKLQNFVNDPEFETVMKRIYEIGNLPGGFEELAKVEWGTPKVSTLPQDLKKEVRRIGQKYGIEKIGETKSTGLSSDVIKRTFIDAVRKTAQEELDRRAGKTRDRAADAAEHQKGEVTQPGFEGIAEEDVPFMTAWHGSPHKFEKFDISKIGTGEGAQAYGHGLYFTDKEEIADYYKKQLANRNLPARDVANVVRAARQIKNNLSEFESTDSDRAMAETLLQNPNFGAAIDASNMQVAFKIASDAIKNVNTGAKYKVELKPAEDEYLLWDRPFSDQSEKVRKAILEKPSLELDDPRMGAILDSTQWNEEGRSLYRLLSSRIAESNNATTTYDDKSASDFLHSLGIRGIKYLDATNRNQNLEQIHAKITIAHKRIKYAEQKGDTKLLETWKKKLTNAEQELNNTTYNYVIFSDEDIEIQDIQFTKELNRQSEKASRHIRRIIANAKSAEDIVLKAKTTFHPDKNALEINAEARLVFEAAIAVAQKGKESKPFWGAYLRQENAVNLWGAFKEMRRRYMQAGEANTAIGLDKIINEFEKAISSTDTGDVILAVNIPQYPLIYKFALQEEQLHRADFQVREFKALDIEAYKALDSYNKAVENIKPDYPDANERTLHNEVIAKSFRDDAEEVLGITETERKEIEDAYIDSLINAGITPDSIEIAFGEITPRAKELVSNVREKSNRRTEGFAGAGEIDEPEISRQAEISPESPSRRSTITRERERPGSRLSGAAALARVEQETARAFQEQGLISPAEKRYIEIKTRKNLELRTAVEDEVQFARAADKGRMTIGKVVIDLANAPKAIKSSVDASAAGRQGLITGMAHPLLASKAFFRQLRAAIPIKGAEFYKRFKTGLDLHPFIELAEESGLYLASLAEESGNLSDREENFMSGILGENRFFKRNKFEAARKLVSAPVRLSSRAYNTYLDSLRMDTFTKLSTEMHKWNMRRGQADDPAQYEGIAKFINYATGRGDLGRFNNAVPILNATFWSVRYWASRLQVMNPAFYAKLPLGARAIVIKDLMKFIGGVGAVMVLLKLAGFDIEYDDPNDPNTLKIGFGNYKYDITGGLIQHLRYAARMALATQEDRPTDKMTYLTERYVRAKLAPVPSGVWSSLAGKNFIGEPTDWSAEGKGLLLPISFDNFSDAAKADGVPGIVKMAPEFFGISTTRYSESEELRAEITKEQAKLAQAKTPEERKEAIRRVKAWESLLKRSLKYQALDKKKAISSVRPK